MINFKLCTPVFLNKHLNAIAEATDLTKEDVYRIASYSSGIITTGEDKYKVITSAEAAEAGKKILDAHKVYEPLAADNVLTGTEGLVWYMKEKLPEDKRIKPLINIHIPAQMFYETEPAQWMDISQLTASLFERNKRLDKLISMDAPETIIFNETRMLREYTERLESNSYGRILTRDKNTKMRALNDLGYSLDGGWDKEMLEEFERRCEEARKEFEEAEIEEAEVSEEEA